MLIWPYTPAPNDMIGAMVQIVAGPNARGDVLYRVEEGPHKYEFFTGRITENHPSIEGWVLL